MGQLQNLENQIIPTTLVKVSDRGGFEVRGLSPYDITAMFLRHGGELNAIFDQFATKVRAGEAVNLGDGAAIIGGVLETAPLLIAEVIALATGADPADGDDWVKDVAVARKLSLGVQTEAVQQIAALTFTEDMPPGKFLSLALDAMQSATGALNKASPVA